MRGGRNDRNIDKEQEALHIEKIRLKYNLLGILVLVLMGILAFDLGGVGTWLAYFLGG